MTHVDVQLGLIRKGTPVWGHHGQLKTRERGHYIAPEGEDHRIKLEDGRTMVFKYVKWRKVCKPA